MASTAGDAKITPGKKIKFPKAFVGYPFDKTEGLKWGFNNIQMTEEVVKAHGELVQTIDQITGEQGLALEQNETSQDNFLVAATKSKGLHGNVALNQIRGLIEGFERIIIDNNQIHRKNKFRHFHAVAELYKYMRGDPRVLQFYQANKVNVQHYALDWMYSSRNKDYQNLAISFTSFLAFWVPDLNMAEILPMSEVPDNVKLKFAITDHSLAQV